MMPSEPRQPHEGVKGLTGARGPTAASARQERPQPNAGLGGGRPAEDAAPGGKGSRPQPRGMSGRPSTPTALTPARCGGVGQGLLAHPGMPPASILLATVTSVDHTSYCQRFWPRTPPSTVPVCTPTRMSTPVFVFSRTYLPGTDGKEKRLGRAPRRRNSARPCSPPARRETQCGATAPRPPPLTVASDHPCIDLWR